MLPHTILETELEATEEVFANKTYKLTAEKIQGTTNDIDALKQAIYKMLDTEKYDYPIYSFSYGIEWGKLIGKDTIYVKIEIERLIREALLQDDRIIDVTNFRFTGHGDELTCEFDIVSIYETIAVTKGVNI